MNLAEKVACTYLRLNGFFVLPHFTVFDGISHNHIDVIGFRPRGSGEFIGNKINRVGINCDVEYLPLHSGLFECIKNTYSLNYLTTNLFITVEVRSNNNRDIPSTGHIEYAKSMAGDGDFIHINLMFIKSDNREVFVSTAEENGKCLSVCISLKHAFSWIMKDRFDFMIKKNSESGWFNKTGSWTWSEENMSDLLYLRELGSLNV